MPIPIEYELAECQKSTARLEEALKGFHSLWLREHGEPTCRCVGCKMDARIREVLGDD